jgi:hypothetical protein
MESLIEIYDPENLDRVLKLSPALLGVNNRNLRTFVTDVAYCEAVVAVQGEVFGAIRYSGPSHAMQKTRTAFRLRLRRAPYAILTARRFNIHRKRAPLFCKALITSLRRFRGLGGLQVSPFCQFAISFRALTW